MFDWIGKLAASENASKIVTGLFIAAAILFGISVVFFGGIDPFLSLLSIICIALAVFLLIGMALIGNDSKSSLFILEIQENLQCFSFINSPIKETFSPI